MNRLWPVLTLSLSAALCAEPARAFCGFYVAKADTTIFNNASQVAIARDGDRTVMTMANDFRGDLKEFAVVIPVPTVVKRERDRGLGQGAARPPRRLLGAAARRVPRSRPLRGASTSPSTTGSSRSPTTRRRRRPACGLEKSRGVTIEAQYTVGEYDILILSAKESGGLELWLRENGYRIPQRRLAGARQLHPPEHALLRRAREPEGAGEDGLHVPAAAAGRRTRRRSSCCPSASAP